MNSAILDRSITALRAYKCKFIIVLPDGTKVMEGDLKLDEPKIGRRRRNPDIPHGSMTRHYMPFLENMKPGDMAEVPFDIFPPSILASSISSRVCQMWGRKAAMTAQNMNKKVIEVLRYA